MGGRYREVVNTDSAHYGGSDMGNGGGVTASDTDSHGFAHSLLLTLPPLATLIFERVAD
jgi:1,4-alpha-glucan branching enzyme